MRTGEIVLDGRTLEAAWWGPTNSEAPTWVLLHEGLGCVRLWRDFPDQLAAHTGCPVFAYSRFGYGRSAPIALPRSMNYMRDEAIDVLPRVLKAVDARRHILLGHSDGGSIAAIYAGRDEVPRPAGVVLIAAHFFVEDVTIESIRQIRAEYDDTDLRSRLARFHDNVDVAFRGWNDAWLDPRFHDFNIVSDLRAITVPVLGIQGASDPYGTKAQLMTLRDNVRSPCRTMLVEGARHAPHFETKDAVMNAFRDFARLLGTEAQT